MIQNFQIYMHPKCFVNWLKLSVFLIFPRPMHFALKVQKGIDKGYVVISDLYYFTLNWRFKRIPGTLEIHESRDTEFQYLSNEY